MNKGDSLKLTFSILLLIIIFFVSAGETQTVPNKIWKQVPIRTEAQKATGMPGGEGMQHVMSMSYAPSNENIVYLVNNTSQVWKSTDGGYSWEMKNNGFDAIGGKSLAVDPANENVVFVAGSRCRNDVSSPVDGIYRTTDGGETWQLREDTFFYSNLNENGGVNFAFNLSGSDIVCDLPGSKCRHKTIYAGTHEDGLLKSTDGGETWNPLRDSGGNIILEATRILDVKISPVDHSIIYVATVDGLYKVSDGPVIGIDKLGETVINHPNLLFNPGFENGELPWYLETKNGANAEFDAVPMTDIEGEYAAKIDIISSISFWEVRLIQDGLAVSEGEDYILKFWMKGEGSIPEMYRDVFLLDEFNNGLACTHNITITGGWQEYILHFSNLSASTNNAKLMFRIGNGTGTAVYIDNVSFSHIETYDNGLPSLSAYPRDFPRVVAIDPTREAGETDVMYVSVGTSGVYKSTDSGDNFSPVNNGLFKDYNDPEYGCFDFPLYNGKEATHLAISPADPNRLYVNFYKWWDINPFYSNDGGQNWYRPQTLDKDDLYKEISDNQVPYFGSAIAPHPNNGSIALVTAGGSHPVKTENGGITYRYSSNGYTGGVVPWNSTSFGFDPYDPDKMVFFLTDFGPYLTLNNGSTFKSIRNYSGYDSSPGAIDFRENEEIIVAAVRPPHQSEYVIAVSKDMGETWKLFDGTNGTDNTSALYKYVAFHPVTDSEGRRNIIYAGRWRSDDRGVNWTQKSMDVRAMFPGDGDIVYAIEEVQPWVSTRICKSLDRGETWNCELYDIVNEAYNNIDTSDITVDPTDEDRIYVAARNALYLWNGSEWLVRNENNGFEKNALDQLSIARVVVDVNNPNIVYAGSWCWGCRSNGVFRSTDYGLSFRKISDIGPAWGALAVNPWNSMLYMGSPYGIHVLCTDADYDGIAIEGGPCGDIDVGEDYDDDGDGYSENQGDCDDSDPEVNPGMTEVPYNGKDDDCDLSTPDDDLDSDGYPIATDCDDTNSSINPGATEVCDEVDNNCDGEIGEENVCDACPLDAENDADGDGVCGDVDYCPDTTLPEDVPTKRLILRHYADIDGDGIFETRKRIFRPIKVKDSKYTLEDTYGCSCEQILDLKPGKNKGEKFFGCAKGTMWKFINKKGWVKDLFE